VSSVRDARAMLRFGNIESTGSPVPSLTSGKGFMAHAARLPWFAELGSGVRDVLPYFSPSLRATLLTLLAYQAPPAGV
jgi:hypothetical protein